MYHLYHFSLCPFSRQIRILLKEKGVEFELVQENYWERREDFARLNPIMEVPVLVGEDGPICEVGAIYEYLEELHSKFNMIGQNLVHKCEIRKITNWVNSKFYHEVTKYIINERVLRYYKSEGEPNSATIRYAKANIYNHIEYMGFLLKRRKYLADDRVSMADIAAASHLSVLDYFGDVPWDYNHYVKEWYSIMKSRPSFRPILADRVSGFWPSKHYTNLDF